MKHIFKIRLMDGSQHTIESDTNNLSNITLNIMKICIENNSKVVSLNEVTASHRNI
jgi:hypothetical protein